MLVLSRKPGERIMIGDNIEVVVLQSRAGCVRLGFNAPDEVTIHREEVHQRVRSGPYAPIHNRRRPATIARGA